MTIPGSDYFTFSRPGGAKGYDAVFETCPEFRTLSKFRYIPGSTETHKWNPFSLYKRVVGPIDESAVSVAYIPEGIVDWTGSSPFPTELCTTTDRRTLYRDGPFGAYGRFDMNLPALASSQTGDPDSDYSEVAPLEGLNELISTSLTKMWPTIKAELSLVNSLIELKDMRSLPETASRIRKWVSSYAKFGNSKRTLRDLTRTTADGYLQEKFNLIPAVQDLVSLWRSIVDLNSKCSELLAHEGKLSTKHYVRVIDNDGGHVNSTENVSLLRAGPVPFPINDWGPNGEPGLRPYYRVLFTRRVEYSPTLFHAELQYSYSYTGLQREHARLLTLLDRLGVNANPAIVWNAIPWSFVVDWVLGVSRWLTTQRLNAMEPRVGIHRFLYSYRRSRHITVSCDIINFKSYYTGDGTEDFVVERTLLPPVFESAYCRSVELPDVASLTTSGLSLTELSLATALAASRRRKVVNRRFRFKSNRKPSR